jgi:hypothetical protein
MKLVGKIVLWWKQRKIDKLSRENRALFLELRQVLLDTVKLEHERQIAELRFQKAAIEREKLLKLLPSILELAEKKVETN